MIDVVRSPGIEVGAVIDLSHGILPRICRVIEDLGPIGHNDKRILRVAFWTGDENGDEGPSTFNVAEADAQPLSMEKRRKIVDYLTSRNQEGEFNFIRMLKAADRVWIWFNKNGDVQHTFQPRFGAIGGAKAPLFAWHEGQIFAPKQDEVVAFLKTFGLDNKEASEVVATIGLGP